MFVAFQLVIQLLLANPIDDVRVYTQRARASKYLFVFFFFFFFLLLHIQFKVGTGKNVQRIKYRRLNEGYSLVVLFSFFFSSTFTSSMLLMLFLLLSLVYVWTWMDEVLTTVTFEKSDVLCLTLHTLPYSNQFVWVSFSLIQHTPDNIVYSFQSSVCADFYPHTKPKIALNRSHLCKLLSMS